jgi:hypothetical protein
VAALSLAEAVLERKGTIMERAHSPLPWVVNAYLFQAPGREPLLRDKPVPVTRHLELAQCFPSWQRGHMEPPCVPRSTAVRTLALAAARVTLGLMLSSDAQADEWWADAAQSPCAENSVQDGMDPDPKKGIVRSACLVKDADHTESIARPNYSGNSGWVMGQVGAAIGNADHDASGYVRRAQ